MHESTSVIDDPLINDRDELTIIGSPRKNVPVTYTGALPFVMTSLRNSYSGKTPDSGAKVLIYKDRSKIRITQARVGEPPFSLL